MGVNIPVVTPIVPMRVHGHKHWLTYGADEQPSEYHVVIQYADGETNMGNTIVTINPGLLTSLDIADKWEVLVAAYESGKKPDELVVAMEQYEGLLEVFAKAWRPGLVVVEEA